MQLVLPLASGNANEADSSRIIVGAANAAAVEALRVPQTWPFHTAVLSGPARSGKSLLAKWFRAENPCAKVIDDAAAQPDPDLFHAWNRAQEQRTPLLLITQMRSWSVLLPDLRSRLAAALHISIDDPDDHMLAELLHHHAMRRNLVLDEGAATYLVPRITRSFAMVERVAEQIDRLSMEHKCAPNRSIWREALAAMGGPRQEPLL